MALERQNIEKKDFPIGRRGYDPEAVDAHLSTVADEIDELRRSSRRRTETLASSASEQVRAIVEAAETSAAQIQAEAEAEAKEIRAEASGEAVSTREQATAQAREYVGKVSESTSVMMERLDAMESELGALFESLRTGSNRLNADLQLLEGNLTEVGDSVSPRPGFEPEPGDSAGLDSEPGTVEEVDVLIVEEGEAEPSAGADTTSDAEMAGEDELGEGRSAGAGEDETEGARLIALNMALNGTPREETDRYLAENFKLDDRPALLDEVYASVEG